MKLICISGHSGAGKSRFLAELDKMKIDFHKVVLLTSRQPRDNEVHGKDYYFLPKAHIESLPQNSFFVGKVHDMTQGIDLIQLKDDLVSNNIVIMDLYYKLWPPLKRFLDKKFNQKVQTLSIFLTALDPVYLKSISIEEAKDFIEKEIKRILSWRNKDSETSIQSRCKSAQEEMLNVLFNEYSFDKTIYSAPEGPDGEDDWTKDDEPQGQASLALREFVSLIS